MLSEGSRPPQSPTAQEEKRVTAVGPRNASKESLGASWWAKPRACLRSRSQNRDAHPAPTPATPRPPDPRLA